MNLFFYIALAPYDFAAGQRHYLGNWKGLALKILNFQAPKKSLFSGQPFPIAPVISLPRIKIITGRAI